MEIQKRKMVSFTKNSASKGLNILLPNLAATKLRVLILREYGGSSMECSRLQFECRGMWGVRDVSHHNEAQLT